MKKAYQMVTISSGLKITRAHPADAMVATITMADGWPVRAFEWPVTAGKARGSILFQTGRGDFFEKYLETMAHWHAAGWHVSAFDWRGQGGSGRLSNNPRVGHVDDFSIWVDDLASIWADWVHMTPGPHVVVGHSMGGHIVTRTLIEKRMQPDATVLIAPMMGFASNPLPKGWNEKLAAFLSQKMGSDRPAWPGNERPSMPWSTRQSLLTHDDDRYADEMWWHEHHPELVLGPPSWPWLNAAMQSMAWCADKGRLSTVQSSVLIIGTEGDRLVSCDAIRAMAQGLPNAKLKLFGKDVAHEILRERDGPRGEALAAIEVFLEEKLKP
jgi:lysophospholipase